LSVLRLHGGLVIGNYGPVDDLCALLLAIARSPEAVTGEVVNATGQAITTAGYVRALTDIVGAEPPGAMSDPVGGARDDFAAEAKALDLL
jgi:nucleoside-diphosphate-sugar epimerase